MYRGKKKMKSLQVLTPTRLCIFNCPFCISKSHRHQNNFANNYEKKHTLWKENFIAILKKYQDLKYIVITGTNEPMQDEKVVEEIVFLVKKNRPDIQVEIQTRFYPQREIYRSIDLVAYSISSYNILPKIKPLGQKNRFVILLTDSFKDKSLKRIIEKLPKEVTQVTFKTLQISNGVNPKMDQWICQHRLDNKSYENLKNDIAHYQGELSIRLDENCMESKNRYKIFREDGYLYDDWEEIKISEG